MTKWFPSFRTGVSAPFLWTLLWFLKIQVWFGSPECFGISLVFSFVIHNFLPYTVVIFGTCIIPPKRMWIPYFTRYPQRAYFPQMVGWMNPTYGHDKKVVTGPCHCVQGHCILVVWFVHCSKLLAREVSRAWNPAHIPPSLQSNYVPGWCRGASAWRKEYLFFAWWCYSLVNLCTCLIAPVPFSDSYQSKLVATLKVPTVLIEFIMETTLGTSLVVQWLRLPAPSAGGPGSIPGSETTSHMWKQRGKIPLVATKTWCSQINK